MDLLTLSEKICDHVDKNITIIQKSNDNYEKYISYCITISEHKKIYKLLIAYIYNKLTGEYINKNDNVDIKDFIYDIYITDDFCNDIIPYFTNKIIEKNIIVIYRNIKKNFTKYNTDFLLTKMLNIENKDISKYFIKITDDANLIIDQLKLSTDQFKQILDFIKEKFYVDCIDIKKNIIMNNKKIYNSIANYTKYNDNVYIIIANNKKEYDTISKFTDYISFLDKLVLLHIIDNSGKNKIIQILTNNPIIKYSDLIHKIHTEIIHDNKIDPLIDNLNESDKNKLILRHAFFDLITIFQLNHFKESIDWLPRYIINILEQNVKKVYDSKNGHHSIFTKLVETKIMNDYRNESEHGTNINRYKYYKWIIIYKNYRLNEFNTVSYDHDIYFTEKSYINLNFLDGVNYYIIDDYIDFSRLYESIKIYCENNSDNYASDSINIFKNKFYNEFNIENYSENNRQNKTIKDYLKDLDIMSRMYNLYSLDPYTNLLCYFESISLYKDNNNNKINFPKNEYINTINTMKGQDELKFDIFTNLQILNEKIKNCEIELPYKSDIINKINDGIENEIISRHHHDFSLIHMLLVNNKYMKYFINHIKTNIKDINL